MASGTLERRGGRVNNAHNPSKLPHRDDIEDIVSHMEETTDVFSHLLLNNPKWRKGLSSDQCKLLDDSVKEFRVLCDGLVALLQTFSNRSRRVAAILNRIPELDCRVDMGRYASDLQPELEGISAQISSVEQRYADFTSHFRGLLRISPYDSSQYVQNIRKNREVFKRLDAFWKVVATQLSRREAPSSDIVYDAQYWSAYVNDCLVHAISRLTECADALKNSGKPPKKGFFASFLSKLKRPS